MRVDRTPRRVPRTIVALGVAVLVASLCSTAALAARATQSTKLGGAWSGSYSGGYAGTFTIHWTQTRSSLKGTIALSNPHGTYNITGSVNGTGIKFGAVGVGALFGFGLDLGPVDVWAIGRAVRFGAHGRRTSSDASKRDVKQFYPYAAGCPPANRTGTCCEQSVARPPGFARIVSRCASPARRVHTHPFR